MPISSAIAGSAKLNPEAARLIPELIPDGIWDSSYYMGVLLKICSFLSGKTPLLGLEEVYVSKTLHAYREFSFQF
jgi:hypothetical protein